MRELDALGATVLTGAPVTRVHRDGRRVTGIGYGGREPGTVEADHYISTIPITVLARLVRPGPAEEVRDALAGLKHVSIVFVYLKLSKPQVSPDNWVYLPEHDVTVHRISEFKLPARIVECTEIRGPDRAKSCGSAFKSSWPRKTSGRPWCAFPVAQGESTIDSS